MSFFEAIDRIFRTYVLGNAPVKQIASGFDWTARSGVVRRRGLLLFSDIPNDRIMRWTPGAGVSVYREPSNHANGHTRDREGRLISCEHGGRRVTRTELDGSITVIAERYRGKRLNSPNDVVVKSDGSIWFTDPHYGISTNYEGFKSEQELPCNVYRVDPATGSIEAVITDCNGPNGLAFSPDERRLYVADTGRMFGDDPTHIRVFDVGEDGGVGGGDVFHAVHPGAADGFRPDSDGNLWTSAADGVHCIGPDGALLGKILVPEPVSNVCFGGRAKHRLFVTASTSVYSVVLNREGVQRP